MTSDMDNLDPAVRPIPTHKLTASFHYKPAYDPPTIVPRAEASRPHGEAAGAKVAAGDAADVVAAPEPRAPMAASSKLLIRAGRIIEHADAAAPLQPQHRLQILMAVKSDILSMERAIEVSSKVAKAYISGSAADVDELMKLTRPAAGSKLERKVSVAALTPEDLRKLDDSQRLELLSNVASGKTTMDEALSSAQHEVNQKSGTDDRVAP